MWRFGIPVLVVLTILPIAACAIAAAVLPETVPLKIGFDSAINRWGSKWELLIILGVTSILCNGTIMACYIFAPQLKSMGLLNSPRNNVGIARWILIGAAAFCDALIIGIIVWFIPIALNAA